MGGFIVTKLLPICSQHKCGSVGCQLGTNAYVMGAHTLVATIRWAGAYPTEWMHGLVARTAYG